MRGPVARLDLMRARGGLAVVLALIATLFQAFVAETHVHFDATMAAAAAWTAPGATHRNALDRPSLPADTDVDQCPLCQQQVMGGRTFITDAVRLTPPQEAVFVRIIAAALSTAFLIVSHNWQGRAPPPAPSAFPN